MCVEICKDWAYLREEISCIPKKSNIHAFKNQQLYLNILIKIKINAYTKDHTRRMHIHYWTPLSGEIRTRIKMLVIKKLIHSKFYENIFPWFGTGRRIQKKNRQSWLKVNIILTTAKKVFILDNFIIMNFIFHVTIPLFTQWNTFSINKYDF